MSWLFVPAVVVLSFIAGRWVSAPWLSWSLAVIVGLAPPPLTHTLWQTFSADPVRDSGWQAVMVLYTVLWSGILVGLASLACLIGRSQRFDGLN